MNLHSMLALSWNVHLSWDPQIRGMLFVGIAVLLLIGSVFLILATNVGFRMGLLITLCGLFGWLTILTGVWTVYALKQGPPDPSTHEAKWIVKEIITGDVPSQTGYDPTVDFSQNAAAKKNGWAVLPKEQKDYADTVSATDNALAPAAPAAGAATDVVVPTYKGISPFSKPEDYIVTASYAKGGQSYFPLGIGVRDTSDLRNTAAIEVNCNTSKISQCNNKDSYVACLNGSGPNCVRVKMCSDTAVKSWIDRATYCQARRVYYRAGKGFLHKSHYAVIQVQPVVKVDLTKLPLGSAPPSPKADTSKPITTVVMARELGTQRVLPALWFFGAFAIFIVLAYGLHVRDKKVMALRAAPAAIA